MSALIRCAAVAALLLLSACGDPVPSVTKAKCAAKGGQMSEVTYWTLAWGYERHDWFCVIKIEPTL